MQAHASGLITILTKSSPGNWTLCIQSDKNNCKVAETGFGVQSSLCGSRRHLKTDKSYLMEHLDCNLVLMKPKNQKVFMRLQQVQNEEGNLSDVDDLGLSPPRKTSVTEHKRNPRQPNEARKRGTTRDEDSGLASMNAMSLRALHKSVEIEVSKSSSSARRRQQSPSESSPGQLLCDESW